MLMFGNHDFAGLGGKSILAAGAGGSQIGVDSKTAPTAGDGTTDGAAGAGTTDGTNAAAGDAAGNAGAAAGGRVLLGGNNNGNSDSDAFTQAVTEATKRVLQELGNTHLHGNNRSGFRYLSGNNANPNDSNSATPNPSGSDEADSENENLLSSLKSEMQSLLQSGFTPSTSDTSGYDESNMPTEESLNRVLRFWNWSKDLNKVDKD